jgi:hypothetical protein
VLICTTGYFVLFSYKIKKKIPLFYCIEPDPGYGRGIRIRIYESHCIRLLMSNYLSFSPFLLALFVTSWIRTQGAIECGSGSETLLQ